MTSCSQTKQQLNPNSRYENYRRDGTLNRNPQIKALMNDWIRQGVIHPVGGTTKPEQIRHLPLQTDLKASPSYSVLTEKAVFPFSTRNARKPAGPQLRTLPAPAPLQRAWRGAQAVTGAITDAAQGLIDPVADAVDTRTLGIPPRGRRSAKTLANPQGLARGKGAPSLAYTMGYDMAQDTVQGTKAFVRGVKGNKNGSLDALRQMPTRSAAAAFSRTARNSAPGGVGNLPLAIAGGRIGTAVTKNPIGGLLGGFALPLAVNYFGGEKIAQFNDNLVARIYGPEGLAYLKQQEAQDRKNFPHAVISGEIFSNAATGKIAPKQLVGDARFVNRLLRPGGVQATRAAMNAVKPGSFAASTSQLLGTAAGGAVPAAMELYKQRQEGVSDPLAVALALAGGLAFNESNRLGTGIHGLSNTAFDHAARAGLTAKDTGIRLGQAVASTPRAQSSARQLRAAGERAVTGANAGADAINRSLDNAGMHIGDQVQMFRDRLLSGSLFTPPFAQQTTLAGYGMDLLNAGSIQPWFAPQQTGRPQQNRGGFLQGIGNHSAADLAMSARQSANSARGLSSITNPGVVTKEDYDAWMSDLQDADEQTKERRKDGPSPNVPARSDWQFAQRTKSVERRFPKLIYAILQPYIDPRTGNLVIKPNTGYDPEAVGRVKIYQDQKTIDLGGGHALAGIKKNRDKQIVAASSKEGIITKLLNRAGAPSITLQTGEVVSNRTPFLTFTGRNEQNLGNLDTREVVFRTLRHLEERGALTHDEIDKLIKSTLYQMVKDYRFTGDTIPWKDIPYGPYLQAADGEVTLDTWQRFAKLLDFTTFSKQQVIKGRKEFMEELFSAQNARAFGLPTSKELASAMNDERLVRDGTGYGMTLFSVAPNLPPLNTHLLGSDYFKSRTYPWVARGDILGVFARPVDAAQLNLYDSKTGQPWMIMRRPSKAPSNAPKQPVPGTKSAEEWRTNPPVAVIPRTLLRELMGLNPK